MASESVGTEDLAMAIESQHGGKAVFAHAMPVTETWNGKVVWDGEVSVSDLTGSPLAKRAYAWSEPVGDGNKRRFFAALHAPPIDSALAAVKASMVHRARSK